MLREKFSGLTDLIDSTQQGLGQINQFLGMNISDSPMSIIKSGMSEKAYLMVILALLIPIISYLTQVISIKMMSQDTNVGNDAMAGQMKMMNRIMPLFSLFFCFSVPVGLGIYWIISALVRSVQQYSLNKHFEKVDMDEVIRKNQEKAKLKREKKGISESQIYQSARLNTKKIAEPKLSSAERDRLLEEAAEKRSSAKPGSMAEKANLVKKFNEKNTK